MKSTQFEIWLKNVNKLRKLYWDKNYSYKEYQPMTAVKGKKYIKLLDDSSVWGFVSMFEGANKGSVVRKGDLLMAAGWSSPARHSRGNIFDGTDEWTFNGPKYLK